MWTWLLCLVLPATSIVLAALAQLLLQKVWPMSQHYGIWGITVESYVAVAILALLS